MFTQRSNCIVQDASCLAVEQVGDVIDRKHNRSAVVAYLVERFRQHGGRVFGSTDEDIPRTGRCFSAPG